MTLTHQDDIYALLRFTGYPLAGISLKVGVGAERRASGIKKKKIVGSGCL